MVAEKLDPKETITFEELLISNVIEQEGPYQFIGEKRDNKQG